MKGILAVTILTILTSCTNSKQKLAATEQDSAIYYPYTPTYSELQKGKASYAKMVLEVWRAYETGNIMSATENFADSIKLNFEDKTVSGSRDSVLHIFQERRNAYTDVQAYVDSWMPLQTKENKQNIVLIWGKLDCRRKNKERDYFVLHQVWWFNDSGKIQAMYQYLTNTD